jgi:formimidoylglutamate deiminase
VEAELTWLAGRFEDGVAVLVDQDGVIAGVEAAGRSERDGVRRSLPRRALVPGFVNAHSHAFQRGLRGAAESFAPEGGNFWSWRDVMYELSAQMDADRLFELSLLAFSEMRDAGITTVGEFHYLHHQKDRDFALDLAVLAAAEEAGIRLVLLQTMYRSAGFGRPLEPAQERFGVEDAAAYWRQVDSLGARLSARQSIGAAGHSIRAVAPDDLCALRAEAARRGMVFHIHLEEQGSEVADCLAAYGRTPMQIVLERLGPVAGVTAVHCTVTRPADQEAFLADGGSVCVCPLTEANLGDGLPVLAESAVAAGRIALGTDSNARISMIEEMRWLELGQRLRTRERGVLRGDTGAVAGEMVRAATVAGAGALGIAAGVLAKGAHADFALLDLDHPALHGATASDLPAAWVFGAGDNVVCATAVAGAWRPSRGRL